MRSQSKNSKDSLQLQTGSMWMFWWCALVGSAQHVANGRAKAPAHWQARKSSHRSSTPTVQCLRPRLWGTLHQAFIPLCVKAQWFHLEGGSATMPTQTFPKLWIGTASQHRTPNRIQNKHRSKTVNKCSRRALHTHKHTCSELSLWILLWNASYVQKHFHYTWQEWVSEETRKNQEATIAIASAVELKLFWKDCWNKSQIAANVHDIKNDKVLGLATAHHRNLTWK